MKTSVPGEYTLEYMDYSMVRVSIEEPSGRSFILGTRDGRIGHRPQDSGAGRVAMWQGRYPDTGQSGQDEVNRDACSQS